MVDNVIAINACVYRRKSLERFGCSPHEERHKTQLGAIVSRLKLVLIALAQLHDGLHINFIERRQHRDADDVQ